LCLLVVLRAATVVFGSILALAGCQSSPPAVPDPITHAVSGKVLAKDGRPVAGGAIQFRGVEDPALASLGSIEPDGAFKLRTNLADGRQLPGAVTGNYQVTVFPPQNAPQSEAVRSLRKIYRVEARDNELTIQLESRLCRSVKWRISIPSKIATDGSKSS
jgi:hypothetical protein